MNLYHQAATLQQSSQENSLRLPLQVRSQHHAEPEAEDAGDGAALRES